MNFWVKSSLQGRPGDSGGACAGGAAPGPGAPGHSAGGAAADPLRPARGGGAHVGARHVSGGASQNGKIWGCPKSWGSPQIIQSIFLGWGCCSTHRFWSKLGYLLVDAGKIKGISRAFQASNPHVKKPTDGQGQNPGIFLVNTRLQLKIGVYVSKNLVC